MRPVTEQLHDAVVKQFDRMITLASEAKKCFVRRQYVDAAGYLDNVAAVRKKVVTLIHEIWEEK